MTYKEFIDNIITTRGRHGCGNEYYEKHHIVPKCLGGENKEENYIDLFAREHYEAHKLLALENPHESKLQYAWWMMCNCTHAKTNIRKYNSANDYQQARIAFAKAKSQSMQGIKMSEDSKNKIRKAKLGTTFSKEVRAKVSKHHADVSGINHPRHRPIICIETGKEYWGAMQAAKELNLDFSSIGKVCKGKLKTCGGFHWKYKENEDC